MLPIRGVAIPPVLTATDRQWKHSDKNDNRTTSYIRNCNNNKLNGSLPKARKQWRDSETLDKRTIAIHIREGVPQNLPNGGRK